MKRGTYKHFSKTLALLFLLLTLSAIQAKEPVLEQLIITKAGGPDVTYKVEVARTPSQMQRGLMFRDTMADDQGMIFIYEPERPARMWMKNTILSLDMLFIDRQGVIINIVENTTPFSLETIESGGPVRAVLELNAGQADIHSFAIGDRVTHPLFDVE